MTTILQYLPTIDMTPVLEEGVDCSNSDKAWGWYSDQALDFQGHHEYLFREPYHAIPASSLLLGIYLWKHDYLIFACTLDVP